MVDSDFNNDPRIIDELHHLRAENNSLFQQISTFRETNDFLRQIINTLITSRNA